GGVRDRRVFEAIVSWRAAPGGDGEPGGGEPVERGLEGGVVDPAHVPQQRISEITAQYGADLRDFARFAEPVEPRRERLLKRRRDRLRAARLAALEQKARDLLDEQRHATGALVDPLNDAPGQRMMGREFTNHFRDLRAIE